MKLFEICIKLIFINIQAAWEENSKILAVSYRLIEPLKETFLDDDEFEDIFADCDVNKFVQESTDVYEGIESFNADSKNYNESVVVNYDTEKLKHGIDIMLS